MKRIIASSVLMGILASGSVHAADSISEQASSLALQQAATKKPPRRNAEMYWGGAVLAGIGGGLLGWAITMPHGFTCVGFGAFVTCEEQGANRGMLIGLGAAMAAGGIVISAIGGQRISVSPSRGGVSASYTWPPVR